MSLAQHTLFPASLQHLPVLIVPGLRNSDEQHWQSQWQAQLPTSKRIKVDDWNTADLDKWKAGIHAELARQTEPVVIIAHSFGTLASASIAAEMPEKIAALFWLHPLIRINSKSLHVCRNRY